VLTRLLRCGGYRNQLSLDHDAFLINSRGLRLTTQGAARIVSRLATDAGIHSRVTPHVLRHTVATLLLRLGADIRVVQEVLGHASIATTQRYTHVTKEHLRSTLAHHHPNHHLQIAYPRMSLERGMKREPSLLVGQEAEEAT